jgi:hypothetical protein
LVGDTKAAAIVAISTDDVKPGAATPLKVEGLGQKIAALLGTSADQILVNDMAVNLLRAGSICPSRAGGGRMRCL